ncbi:molybdenum ABC transporter permease subunit [Oleiphilus sp. HI0071]|jgi:molybdate transport system permease protein|nr:MULTISPECIES: molybdate ABC transporter permease subunit [unclassified Oleiphilus]KZY61498.1 molybdenum ABC transporter permease subunit [Oleiphilus sp. HI0065]KZY78338.1 molybdenum ABC transporter permease subunit [Oleiphilus sp. HI0071]KZY89187.1 molybdenum ABC transporter permease subunit [Oleiphilus sp. HI0073]KZZ52462.1 molybdenum ABC transporter permease subunit [Oleiphilus sp. HI0118]KZZ58896.1 molybdenum ABC transporter permease subunit [Oleiphilus sp. HI0122]KZZ68259.1 molybdenum 
MSSDWTTLWLSLRLAFVTMAILLLISTPLAWWLSQTTSKLKPFVLTIITLPIVLPPTVLGFYLLLLMSPSGLIGQLTDSLGLGPLVFTFWGLVIGSIIYSLPFAVQPIYNAFSAIDKGLLELGTTMGASARQRFLGIALPLAKTGLISAAILSFAHTLGEFGVILMIGGNIPDETRVLSIAIYDHVESLNYEQAHVLSFGLLVFAFLVIWSLAQLQQRGRKGAVRAGTSA